MKFRLLALGLFASFSSAGADEPKKISYYRDVRPILQQHCMGCHQPAKPLGGYIMTTYAELLKKGERDKPGVVPFKPNDSDIIEQATPHDGKAEMPKNRDPIPTFQLNTLRDWIAQGAIDDTPKVAAALIDADHPPTYQALPVVTALAFSPDHSILAVSGYHEVLLLKADGSGTIGRLIGESESIQSLAFSPNGKLLAVSGGSPGRFGEVQIWDIEKQKLTLSVPVTFDTVYGVSWSHDGSKIAFGCGDNTVRAIDVSNGKQVLYQGAHSDWVLDTAFSADSQYLVSISRDRSMKLTELATQRFIDNVTSISPNVLRGGLSAVERRPQKDSTRMSKVPPDTPGVPAKPYDELLIGGVDGVPRLYKMHRETKRVIGDDANKVREFAALPGRIYALSFNVDGSQFAVGSSLDGAGEVRVYDAENAKLIAKLDAIPTPIYAVAFRQDGKVVASAGFDGMIRLHDAATGKLIKEFAPVSLTK